MRMTAPLEVAVVCDDLDRLQRFYVDALGCAHVGTLDVPAEMAARAGLSDGGYRVVRLQTPRGERIKLFRPDRKAAVAPAAVRVLDRRGVAFLTFIVDGIAAVVERCAAHGADLPQGVAPVELRPGVRVAFLRDPEGNALEIVEYADVTAYRPDLAG